MKRGTISHPKIEALICELGIKPVEAVGHIEALFHFVGEYAPAGNVGKWPNAAIARKCLWEGDADVFVRALVETHWLDENAEHRLIVHDWSEHADDGVHCAVARKQSLFADGTIPRLGKLNDRDRERARKFYDALQKDQENQGSAISGDLSAISGDKRPFSSPLLSSPLLSSQEEIPAAPLLARDGTRAPDEPQPTRHPVQLLSSSLPDPSTWGPEPTTDDPIAWLKQHTIFGDPRYIPEPAALVQTLRASWPEVDLCAAFSAAAKYIATSGPPRNGIRHAVVNEVRFTSERRVRREAAKESQDAAHEKAIQEVFERHRKKRAAAEAGGTTA